MSKPFQPLTTTAKVRLSEESLAFWQAEFHAAQAIVEYRLETINDFCTRARLWRKEDVRALSTLTQSAYEAKVRMNHAYARLVREFLEYVKVGETGEEAP